MDQETVTTAGPFQVTINSDEVAAFCAAVGFPPGHTGVPLIYPIRMLADRQVVSAIEAAAYDAVALLHQAQSFTCHLPLVVNHTYRLDLRLERSEGRRPRLLVSGTITAPDNRLIQEFKTTLVMLQRQ
jgi:hypothetical protein